MTAGARHLVVLVGRELRQLARSPVALVLTFVAPVAAAVIASAAFGSPPTVDAKIVVVGADRQLGDLGDLASLATPADGSDEMLEWVVLDDPARARAMVSAGDASAALILPSPSDPDATVEAVVNRNERITADLAALAARTAATRLSLHPSQAPAAGGTEPARAPDLEVVGPGHEALSGAELYGPVIAVFFAFLTAGFVGRGLHNERERGTLTRLRTVPIATGTIVSSKVATVVLIGILEITAVLAAMSVLYGARWGNLLALTGMVVAIACAVGATAMLIAGLVRSPQAAHAAEVNAALGLGVLGGQIVPLRNLPDGFGEIAAVMPNGVAINAMRDIAANELTVVDVHDELLLVAGFAAVVAFIAFRLVRLVVEQ